MGQPGRTGSVGRVFVMLSIIGAVVFLVAGLLHDDDALDKQRQRLVAGNLVERLRVQKARGAGNRDKAERVRPGVHRRQRIFSIGNAANFNMCQHCRAFFSRSGSFRHPAP